MGKKILITGCSTGFGFEGAKYLAGKGHHVFATMRGIDAKNAEAAERLRSYAQDKRVAIDVLELDVTSDASVAAAVAPLPTIDVLINNAGVGFGGPVEAFSADQVTAQLDVNIVGTVRVSKAVLPGMRAQGSGLIIQLSSIAGRLAVPGFGVYHASKWGLEGLSECMRLELAPFGIDVALVEPGPFSTGFFGNVVRAQDAEAVAAYAHVDAYLQEFTDNVRSAFEEPEAPTDPMLVVETFETLINLPAGQRPLRSVAGLDFGCRALNEAVSPVRQAILSEMGLLESA